MTNTTNTAANTTFKTCNRKLEQFLFMHGIRFVRFSKDADNITYWHYTVNEETMRVVDEWRDINSRRVC